MERTLFQQNGKNWRKFVVEDDQLISTVQFEGVESSVALPFDEVGLVSKSFDQSVIKEKPFSDKFLTIGVVIFLLVLVISIFMMSLKNNPVLVVIGALVTFSSIAGLVIMIVLAQPKNVKSLGVYLGRARIWLYARDNQDAENVRRFVDQIDKAQRKYFKKKYLAHNDALTKDQVKGRLSWLFENHIITEQELAAQLKKLSKK